MAEIRDGLASTGCTFVGGFDAEEYPGCGSRLCQDGEAIGWAVDDSASDAENQMRMELWIAAIG
jgi:flavodoxin I